MSREGVRVLHLFGRDYAIKPPPGEEQRLQEAMTLLQAEITGNQRRFPQASSQELLLLSALNLCARQLAERPPADAEARLDALNRRILAQLQAST